MARRTILAATAVTRAPYKPAKLEVARDAHVLELAQVALERAAEQMRRNTAGARAGTDPEYVHQLRVGARRLRVVLRVFRKPIGKAVARPLRDDARWIFRRLGEVRDYDVLLGEVVGPLRAGAPSATLTTLAADLGRERAKRLRAARRALSSRRYTGLVAAARTLAAELAQRRDDSPSARKWARRRLDAQLEAALALVPQAHAGHEHAGHELRKQLKALRYLVELMRGLWHPHKLKPYLASLAGLQDELGVLNDGAVARRLLAESRARLGAEAAPAIDLCERALAEREEAPRRNLRRALARIEAARPFWR